VINGFKINNIKMRISITKLEEARVDARTVAKLLTVQTSGGGGKTFKGVFGTYIGKFHNDETDIGKLVTQLSDAFKLGFVPNEANYKKSNKYVEAFIVYAEYMSKYELGLDAHFTNVNWAFDKDLSLYGRSPTLCSSDTRNIAFAITENSNNWLNELKFPILQKYLADKYFKCDVDKVEMGVFDVTKKAFEFKIFSNDEIEEAILQTTNILLEVKHWYDQAA
jgi:hypothetical protein